MGEPRVIAREGDRIVVALADDRLLEDLVALQWHLEDVLGDGPPTVVVDLSGVSALSSPVIRALLRTRRRVRARGGRVALQGLSRQGMDVLERTGLRPLFDGALDGRVPGSTAPGATRLTGRR